MSGFEIALVSLKRGDGSAWRRAAWKPGKWIALQPPRPDSMSYLEIKYFDGRAVPWHGTRCDLLEEDWEAILPQDGKVE